MAEIEGFKGITVGGAFTVNKDTELKKNIVLAVEKIQKKLGPDGYLICTECALGISGNKITTPPEYIANYCKGDCVILGLCHSKIE